MPSGRNSFFKVLFLLLIFSSPGDQKNFLPKEFILALMEHWKLAGIHILVGEPISESQMENYVQLARLKPSRFGSSFDRDEDGVGIILERGNAFKGQFSEESVIFAPIGQMPQEQRLRLDSRFFLYEIVDYKLVKLHECYQIKGGKRITNKIGIWEKKRGLEIWVSPFIKTFLRRHIFT